MREEQEKQDVKDMGGEPISRKEENEQDDVRGDSEGKDEEMKGDEVVDGGVNPVDIFGDFEEEGDDKMEIEEGMDDGVMALTGGAYDWGDRNKWKEWE